MPDDMNNCGSCQNLTFFISACFHCEAKICRECYRNNHGDNCLYNQYKQKTIQTEKEKEKWRPLTEEELVTYERNRKSQINYTENMIENDKLDIEKYYRWIKKDKELMKKIPKRIKARKRAIEKKRKRLEYSEKSLEHHKKPIDYKKLEIADDGYITKYKHE
ncbi:hypothetical protein LCGC14_0196360 [marine sediment metagenome]|uniref:Uncharacterized protein n=1 Tax=marine sediment metagenome TaxID=412755 RepID=A0A0F9XNM2_9ZZZZ